MLCSEDVTEEMDFLKRSIWNENKTQGGARRYTGGKGISKKQSGSDHKRGKLVTQISHSEVIKFDLHSVANI